ncbi:DinB superfamily protein [Bacillus sp. OV322]|uniref:DinB family protein n=1 Tax=Bacillus sp. OV322 TaxID=1882764 RepID=UPI0008F087B1|nr:DinB family protein [Bacillus sp. OV322]SFC03195.1 DinB superfamily protein [Bacillus sp. OV322]
MDRNGIADHYTKYSEWLQSLKEMDETEWITPVSEGKWPPAAIISHIYFWDTFSLHERFPFIEKNAKLSPYPDFQEFNKEAEKFAASGISKEELLNKLLEIREEMKEFVNRQSDDMLDAPFYIGEHSLTLREYLADFASHDLHHQEQIINCCR